jgi:hypothetical protein
MADNCRDQEKPAPELESESETDEASRRETLKRFGRLATYTAPAVAVLLAPSGRTAQAQPLS